MYFDKPYKRNDFLNLLQSKMFPTFIRNEQHLDFGKTTAYFVKDGIYQLGTVDLDQKIFILEVEQKSSNDPRITLTKDAFKILEYHGIDHAIIIFHCKDTTSYRLSLLTVSYENWEKKTSSYKRFSFIVGPNEKVRTVNQQLINRGQIKSYDDLISRFDVEVVRKEFFETYLELFVRLYKAIQKDGDFVNLLESQNVDVVSFTKNLLGKIIFLYFVQQKGWLSFDKNTKYGEGSKNFMRDLRDNFKRESESLSEEKTGYFYNDYLEWLFFAGLNKDRSKDGDWLKELKVKVPYLNGGLFKEEYEGRENNESEINNDIFSNIEKKGDEADGILDIFDRYNFTIDEDSLYDTDIAVDPEMLGRIFEKMISISSENIKDVLEIYDKKKTNAKFDFGKDLNKKLGAFYTPREIVHYMTKESLVSYLQNKVNLSENNIRVLFELKEKFLLNSEDMKKAEYPTETLVEIGNNVINIDNALKEVKILDPAVGSGAFPMGLLHEISSLRYYMYGVFNRIFEEKTNNYKNRDGKISLYKIKKDIILNNIYGVDIDPGAIDIAKLRFRLSLVVDEQEPEPLPNFEFKFVCADSLIPLEEGSLFTKETIIEQLKELREKYYKCADKEEKNKLKGEFINIKNALTGFGNLKDASKKDKELLYKQNLDMRNRQISEWNPFETKEYNKWLDTELMMGQDKFDIVIGNPPYISTKGVTSDDKKKYEKVFGFSDDTYNLFMFKGLSLTKSNGVCSYIIPKTFWTTQTKRNMRDLLLSKQISYIFDTAEPFDTAMVDTCVIQVKNVNYVEGHKIKFLDGSKGLETPKLFQPISQGTYIHTQNAVIFTPNELNLKIWNLYGEKVNKLYDERRDKIKTSKDIDKNWEKLENYRNNLKPGDVALLGCLTEGGQGLATANNGKYIAIRKSTKWAKGILESRPKKLGEAAKKIKSIDEILKGNMPEEYLEGLSENEITDLFDSLREKYGRDIFGQGYIYKLIDDCEIADVNSLTVDEKENGIETSKKYYVPYDKGDKDGNRWYLETPFAIAWSKENVQYLKTDPKARYQGYSFFFKEGFCRNNVLNPNARLLKVKIKNPSVNDVGAMSLSSLSKNLPNYFFVCLLNSNLIFDFYREFINCTVNIQINDIRQLPVVIPDENKLRNLKNIFDEAYDIKKKEFDGQITSNESEEKLNDIQYRLDKEIESLYHL